MALSQRPAPPGGVTGGAARLLASLGRRGPLPPSPGAAAGGRMEQGLSAITLYCAPATGPAAAACAMEPEQVSGTTGARRGRGRGGSGGAAACVAEPSGRAGGRVGSSRSRSALQCAVVTACSAGVFCFTGEQRLTNRLINIASGRLSASSQRVSGGAEVSEIPASGACDTGSRADFDLQGAHPPG